VWIAGLALSLFPLAVTAQTANPAAGGGPGAQGSQSAPANPTAGAQAAAEIPAPTKPSNEPRGSARRKAAKLYLGSSKLFLNRQFEDAMQGFEQAAALDPSNPNYALAANVARSHAVTALIQAAAKDRMLGNESAARGALMRALALDPKNFEASQHLDELGQDQTRKQPKSLYAETASKIAGVEELLTAPGPQSFHLRADQRSVIGQVFKAYGVMAMLDDGVPPVQVRVDLDDIRFADAARILSLVTHTFFVPLDAHHVLVANDTRDSRERFLPQETETVYLPGLNADDMNQVVSLAKDVFQAQQAQLAASPQALTIRAPAATLDAFNATLRSLLEGRSQVVLDVNVIQVAHTGERNTGVQMPQSIAAFNVLAEEQTLLNGNSTLVQEIISSGLASADNPLAILGILIASGQVSSPLLTSGFALFGGGLTESALVPGTAKLNLNLNTSDSRALDQIQLHLEDGEDGTIKEGERYPIQTSSYSSLSGATSKIAGLTSAGTSSSLTSLLSSLSSSAANIPMVQYEDLGLTLKVNPRVLRNGDVALSIDLKLDALAGTSINGNPVLANRAYSGVVTLREGDAAVVVTEMDKSQSLAISGTPGISEIPGLNDVTGRDMQKNYAMLVIVMTPHVVRGPQAIGHTAMMHVERGSETR
jgi:tetratricopeptide (TPR) repeat protein